MHVIAVLALPQVVAFDLAIPCEVFGRATLPSGAPAYQVRVCGEGGLIETGRSYYSIRLTGTLDDVASADMVVVAGIEDPNAPVSETVLNALRQAAGRGARIASICSGAFVLAAAGLLDGQRATTHWLAAAELARRYPLVEVDPNVLFVDNGTILTSAGAAAGLDLCLHLVRRDLGAQAAADAARLAVVPLERDGGQSQFITHHAPLSSDSLDVFLAWLADHLQQPMTLEAMARQAGLSERTFSRRFREQVGTTPLQWLLTARVRQAQALLESTDLTVERIATHSGFESAMAFRNRFSRVTGLSPSVYRKRFGGGDAPRAAERRTA